MVKEWRRRLCTEEDAGSVLAGLDAFYAANSDDELGVAA
jgi:hypothetical protein